VGVGPTIHRLIGDYRGKIKLVVKMYPYQFRDYSRQAAEALLAANEQGKFWEMHSILLNKSPLLDRSNLIRYAGEVGLDSRRFTESLDKKRFDGQIEDDIRLAKQMDLYSTPAFFINGRKVIGNRPYPFFKKIIDEELHNAGKK
jgi:protein-disulfide isomerase